MSAGEWLTAAGVLVLLIAIVTPKLQRMRMTSGRQKCPSNLRQIGQGVLLYSLDHAGKCPSSLAELLAEVDMTHEVFVCPSDPDDRARGESSYVYLGAGRIFKDMTADEVLAYDPISIHQEGGNVLFGDGHVEFIEASGYKDVEKGIYPARPASQPN